MILSITFLILAIAAYSVSQLAQHNKLKWQRNNLYGFWGEESWRRKYKEFDPEDGPLFPGSTTFFVFLTDGYHFAQMLFMLFLSLSFGFLMSNHWYSAGAWGIIHIVHWFVYKTLSK
jgi:hypothetical protein